MLYDTKIIKSILILSFEDEDGVVVDKDRFCHSRVQHKGGHHVTTPTPYVSAPGHLKRLVLQRKHSPNNSSFNNSSMLEHDVVTGFEPSTLAPQTLPPLMLQVNIRSVIRHLYHVSTVLLKSFNLRAGLYNTASTSSGCVSQKYSKMFHRNRINVTLT